MADINQQLLDAIDDPADVTVDGTTVTARPLSDLIALDKHLLAKTASDSRKARGFMATKLVPPGMAD